MIEQLAMPDEGPRVRAAPLIREQVYEGILEEIVAGRLAPGDRITERVMARRWGVSTTPVKEALRRLENEGFVHALPRRGVVVRDSALASLTDVITARAWLEGLAARLTAERYASDRIENAARARLKQLLPSMRALTASSAVEDLVVVNGRFHELIRDMSGNRAIEQLVGMLLGVDAAVRRQALAKPPEMRRGLREHVAIHHAIVAGDAELAERRMRDHILRSGASTVSGTDGGGSRRKARQVSAS